MSMLTYELCGHSMDLQSSDTMIPPLRTRRRGNETLRIVRVALSLFLERGLDQVTVDEIADAADISRRTFFRYFPSKDGLLAMLHQRAMRRVAIAWQNRPADEPFIDSMVNASRSVSETDVAPDENALNQLSIKLLIRNPDAWERIVKQIGRSIVKELEGVIAFRLRQCGKDDGHAGPLAALAWSVGCFVFREWLESGAKDILSDRLEAALYGVRSDL